MRRETSSALLRRIDQYGKENIILKRTARICPSIRDKL